MLSTARPSCQIIARYLLKVADFNLRHLHLMTPFEFRPDLWRQKTNSAWAIVWQCLHDYFGTIPNCDRQTGTHRHMTTAYTMLT